MTKLDGEGDVEESMGCISNIVIGHLTYFSSRYVINTQGYSKINYISRGAEVSNRIVASIS